MYWQIPPGFIITAMGFKSPNFKSKLLHFLYKFYACVLICLLFFFSIWSYFGKLSNRKATLTRILDFLTTIISCLINVASIMSSTFFTSKRTEILQLSANVITDALDKPPKKNSTRAFILFLSLHVFLVIITYFNAYYSIQVTSWAVYQYYVIDVINYYMVIIVLIQIYEFIVYLADNFKILNRILNEVIPSNGFFYDTTQEKLRCLIKLHDTLCDLVDVLNKILGLRILMVMLLTSLSILQSIELLLNHTQKVVIENIPIIFQVIITGIILVGNCILLYRAIHYLFFRYFAFYW